MNDEEKRRWAVEQIIKLHAANGSNTDSVVTEAMKLLKYINEKPEQSKS